MSRPTAASHRGWVGVAALVAMFSCVASVVLAALPAPTHGVLVAWRLTAWLVSAVL